MVLQSAIDRTDIKELNVVLRYNHSELYVHVLYVRVLYVHVLYVHIVYVHILYIGFVNYSSYADFSNQPTNRCTRSFVLCPAYCFLIHNFIALNFTILVYVFSYFGTNVHSTVNAITG